jgi:hypothetical protein
VEKIYSKEDWAKMTLDERSQVRTIRARSQAQGGGTRNISAILTLRTLVLVMYELEDKKILRGTVFDAEWAAAG